MRNVKSCVNRFGTRLTVGDYVRVTLARGGYSYGTIYSFDYASDYAKAYGPHATLTCGGYVCIHDCETWFTP